MLSDRQTTVDPSVTAENRSCGTNQEVVIACHVPVYMSWGSVTDRRHGRQRQPAAILDSSSASANQRQRSPPRRVSPYTIGVPQRVTRSASPLLPANQSLRASPGCYPSTVIGRGVIQPAEDHDPEGSSVLDHEGSTCRSWPPPLSCAVVVSSLYSCSSSPTLPQVSAEEQRQETPETSPAVGKGPNQTMCLCDEPSEDHWRPTMKHRYSVDSFEPQLVLPSVPCLTETMDQTGPLTPDHWTLTPDRSYMSHKQFMLEPCHTEACAQNALAETELISKCQLQSLKSPQQHQVSGREIVLQKPKGESLREQTLGRKLSVQPYPKEGDGFSKSHDRVMHTQVYGIRC